MNGLAILGGIGQGLQQGSQFVRQRKQDDAIAAHREQELGLRRDVLAQNTKESDARLGLLNQEADWKKQDRGLADDERMRQTEYGDLMASTIKEFGPEADPLEVRTAVGERWVKSGRARPGELDKIIEANGMLHQRGLMAAFKSNDLPRIEQELSRQHKRNVRVTVRDTKDQLGYADRIFTMLGDDGKVIAEMTASQLGFMFGVDNAQEKEAQAKLAKTASEIEQNKASASSSRASAGKAAAETKGVLLENEGLAALAPDARAAAGKGGANLTPDAKNAKYMVSVGLAATEGEAFRQLQDDKLMGEAISLMSQNPRAAADPVKAFESARAAVTGRNGPAPAPAPAPAPKAGAPVQVKTRSEALALPVGTRFIPPGGDPNSPMVR